MRDFPSRLGEKRLHPCPS